MPKYIASDHSSLAIEAFHPISHVWDTVFRTRDFNEAIEHLAAYREHYPDTEFRLYRKGSVSYLDKETANVSRFRIYMRLA